MKTYTVKQIAEILGTNPETVRRWIRDDKLKAVQPSRRDGNIVTESDLESFIQSTPKYSSRLALLGGLTALTPVTGISVLVGSVLTGLFLSQIKSKGNIVEQVRPEDLRNYLQESISNMEKSICQKQNLIRQTELEIEEIEKQIEQHRFLLEHENMLDDALEKQKEERRIED